MLNTLREKLFVKLLLLFIAAGIALYSVAPSVAGAVCKMKMESESGQCCCCASDDISAEKEVISKNCACSIKETAENPSQQKAVINNNNTNNIVLADLLTPYFAEANFKHSISLTLLQNGDALHILKDIYLLNSNLRI